MSSNFLEIFITEFSKRVAEETAALLESKFGGNQGAEKHTDEPEEYLNTNQVCELLGVCKMTLCRYKRSGYLVPVMLGGRCRYRKSDIEQLLKKGGTK